MRVSSVSVPALPHRIACIHREIDQRPFQFAAVGECLPQVRSQRLLDADVGTQRSAQQVGHAPNDVVEVDDGRFERLFPREREQAVGQFTAAFRRPESIVEVFPSLGIAAHALFQQLQIADDDGEQVVEIVRDAAGELAHGLHLLRLAELLLHLPTLGDVLLHRDEVGDLVPVLDRRDRGKLPEQLAVLLLVEKLTAPHAARRKSCSIVLHTVRAACART